MACSLTNGGGTPAASRLGKGNAHSALCPMTPSSGMAAGRNLPPTQPPAPARRRAAARPAAAATTNPCRPAAELQHRSRRHPTRAGKQNHSQGRARESRHGQQEGATAAASGATAPRAWRLQRGPGCRPPRQRTAAGGQLPTAPPLDPQRALANDADGNSACPPLSMGISAASQAMHPQPLRHTAEKGRGRGINTLATHKSFHSVALNHLLSTVCPNCPTGSTQGGGKQGPRMSGSTMTTMDDDDASSSARHPTVIHKKLYKDQAYLIEYEPRAKNTAHREHQPGVQLIQLGQRAGRRVVALSAATRYE